MPEQDDLTKLLQELRVIQTGVQILGGFMITLPFMAQFEHLDYLQVFVYCLVLLAATVATVLVVGPECRSVSNRQNNKKRKIVSICVMRVSIRKIWLLFITGKRNNIELDRFPISFFITLNKI